MALNARLALFLSFMSDALQKMPDYMNVVSLIFCSEFSAILFY